MKNPLIGVAGIKELDVNMGDTFMATSILF
jgi:hypothetical protein